MLVANRCRNKSVFLARLWLSFPSAARGPGSSPGRVGCGGGHARLTSRSVGQRALPALALACRPPPPPHGFATREPRRVGVLLGRGVWVWVCVGGCVCICHSPTQFVSGHHAGRLPCATTARVPVGASTTPQGLMAGNVASPPTESCSILRVQVSLGPGCPHGDSLPLGACGTSRSPGGGESPSITASPSHDAVSIGTQEATRFQAPAAAAGHGTGCAPQHSCRGVLQVGPEPGGHCRGCFERKNTTSETPVSSKGWAGST